MNNIISLASEKWPTTHLIAQWGDTGCLYIEIDEGSKYERSDIVLTSKQVAKLAEFIGGHDG